MKEAEIRQPWVVNGHNTHTPDSREACQAIAFYDNFTPEKSTTYKDRTVIDCMNPPPQEAYKELPPDSNIPAASQ